MTEDGQRDASTNGSTRRTMAAQFCSQGMNLRNENHESVLAQFSARPTTCARAYHQFGGFDQCHVINDVMSLWSAIAFACLVVGFPSEIEDMGQRSSLDLYESTCSFVPSKVLNGEVECIAILRVIELVQQMPKKKTAHHGQLLSGRVRLPLFYA